MQLPASEPLNCNFEGWELPLAKLKKSEVHTKNGRADAIVQLEEGIYCLEFRLDQSAQIAVEQIQKRGYTERFSGTGKTVHHIGINFSSVHKSVEEVFWSVNP